jgi:hypothetical protein
MDGCKSKDSRCPSSYALFIPPWIQNHVWYFDAYWHVPQLRAQS